MFWLWMLKNVALQTVSFATQSRRKHKSKIKQTERRARYVFTMIVDNFAIVSAVWISFYWNTQSTKKRWIWRGVRSKTSYLFTVDFCSLNAVMSWFNPINKVLVLFDMSVALPTQTAPCQQSLSVCRFENDLCTRVSAITSVTRLSLVYERSVQISWGHSFSDRHGTLTFLILLLPPLSPLPSCHSHGSGRRPVNPQHEAADDNSDD